MYKIKHKGGYEKEYKLEGNVINNIIFRDYVEVYKNEEQIILIDKKEGKIFIAESGRKLYDKMQEKMKQKLKSEELRKNLEKANSR